MHRKKTYSAPRFRLKLNLGRSLLRAKGPVKNGKSLSQAPVSDGGGNHIPGISRRLSFLLADGRCQDPLARPARYVWERPARPSRATNQRWPEWFLSRVNSADPSGTDRPPLSYVGRDRRANLRGPCRLASGDVASLSVIHIRERAATRSGACATVVASWLTLGAHLYFCDPEFVVTGWLDCKQRCSPKQSLSNIRR